MAFRKIVLPGWSIILFLLLLPVGPISVTNAADEIVTYAYDQLDRLVRVEYTGRGSIVYQYDEAGDIIKLSILTANSADTDADKDGIADDWEIACFNNLTAASAITDADDDGYSDLWEYLNGKDGIMDSAGNPFDPRVANASGSRGYGVGLKSKQFWLLVLPAILGK